MSQMSTQQNDQAQMMQQQNVNNNSNNNNSGVPAGGSSNTNMGPGGVLANNASGAMGMPAASASIDMASVLAKIQALEREKQELHSQLESTQTRLSKLQEGKKAEMEQLMNSTINKWLEQLETKDQASKDMLRAGLQKLVNDGNESGVWEVVACASSNWQNNVNQIEALTQEVNSYKEKEKQLQGGLFQSENSRFTEGSLSGHKRSAPEAESEGGMDSGYFANSSRGAGGDMWSELETMFSREGGVKPLDYSQAPPIGAISKYAGSGM